MAKGEAWQNWQIDYLRANWGRVSSGKMSTYLGVTRNAVVGKAHRLGLPSLPSPIKRLEPGQARRDPSSRKSKPLNERPGAAGLQDALAKSVRRPGAFPEPAQRQPLARPQHAIQPSRDRCAYPIGDPRKSDFHFCGDPVQAGSPYCAKHHYDCHQHAVTPKAPDDVHR